MRKCAILKIVLYVSLLASPVGDPPLAGSILPLVDGKPTVAVVNGEAITRDDLRRQVGAIHEDIPEKSTAPRLDPTELLERIINVRLVVQESRVIGLDELPEVDAAIDAYGKNTRRAILFGKRVRNIQKADSKEVERRYQEEVKEVKFVSIIVENEDAAKRLEAEVKAGGVFEKIAKRMIDAREAKGSAEGEYLKQKNLLPEVQGVLAKMKRGDVSPLLQIGKKYTMVKFLAVRFPKDPDVRKRVEMQALEAKRTKALQVYVQELRRKYVRINEQLLNELNYDSPEPGIDRMLNDTRTVAEVKGEKPVTVMELSGSIKKKFYHGMDSAMQKGMVNRRKKGVLDEILFERVTEKEAKRLKITQSSEYRAAIEEYARGVLFGVFVQKVIEPGVTVDNVEIKAYWEQHAKNYTTPEMMRIDSVAFSDKRDAESALGKLIAGADFLWVRANAEGQVEAEKAKNLLSFGTVPIITRDLPVGVQEALTGAVEGEYRLYSAPEGHHHVLFLRQVIPPALQPLDSVESEIAKKLYLEKRDMALNDYLLKLRSSANIKRFAEGAALKRVVREKDR